MEFIEVEDGKPYFCRVSIEQPGATDEGEARSTQSQVLNGIFSIAKGDAKLHLVQFDDYFHLSDIQPLFVRSESNWFASMLLTYSVGSGSNGHTDQFSYSQDIYSSVTIVGWEPWKPEYRVKRTQFRVPGADRLLRHQVTFNSILGAKAHQIEGSEVINTRLSEALLKVNYTGSMSGDSMVLTNITPVIELEFDSPLGLRQTREYLGAFARFLSAVSCAPLRPQRQIVSQNSLEEWMSAMREGMSPIDYTAYYFEGEQSDASEAKVQIYSSFAFIHSDADRDSFVACLVHWMDRYPVWRGACTALDKALRLREESTPERLLNATKWIESTPGAKSEKAIADHHVDELSGLIGDRAAQLGYLDLHERLKGSMRMIAQEPNIDRFNRLADDLRGIFGVDVVGRHLGAWVGEAFRVRGRAAHVHYSADSLEAEMLELTICAAECFAYLLLVRDLPISEDGKRRLQHCEFVRAFRGSTGSMSPGEYKASRIANVGRSS